MKCNNRKIWSWVKELKPVIMMVIVQIAFAGVNVLYKLAADDGMNLRILVAYRFLFATAFIFPLAFFLERGSRPKLTWTILGQAFLCGLLGGSLAQNLYLESIVLTSATFSSALANLVPAVTFILGLTFGLEKLSIKTLAGKAKIFGTFLGISGAMVLTFYKGIEIKLWSVNSHLLKPASPVAAHNGHNSLIGSLVAIAGCVSYAAWLIVQAKMSQRYPCYYSSTALMCTMGTIQSLVFAVTVERDWRQWKLGWNIRLLAVAFTGIVASGMMVALIAWCIRLRGPLFVSVFNPLMVVIVALAGSLVLNEKLYIGSVLGGFLIVLGLYGVVWGKGKEMKKMSLLVPATSANKELGSIEISTTSTVNEQSEVNKSISNPEKSGDVIAN
ncbi:WAT1-related protein At1g25270-like [Silene latifolia]|uniref:WAT1-related protein At1g25270-like n=1 Tax=Silene latifolia TaxID=37657 RepID=UPI003D76A4DB